MGSTGEEVSDSEKMSPRLDEDSEFFLRVFRGRNIESEIRLILQFDFPEFGLVDSRQTKSVIVWTTVQSTEVTCVTFEVAFVKRREVSCGTRKVTQRVSSGSEHLNSVATVRTLHSARTSGSESTT